ncbi:MarR family winged helix-turn-helix transcriptional regulator [Alkalibacillus almallahensis]|uniref:MarR family winged helix-turn-helix transcriptional regulator n=1 Tax=Alkalibacillus almallahensis TaxID=1379154 RepID=UPI0014241587|nr:MarR family winged helix-turn-helix transcriptional regulator [Alkalibacillus almallahensis]NIK12564.1 DNA-binding MarR family transcriptional regulator [Alkalibacillus almallahensis]
MENEVKKMNQHWTDIYYHLHYPHDEKITHQVIRILQHVQKQPNVGVNDIADYINVSQNTASEHVKRMIDKALLKKSRSQSDERKVILCLTEKGEEVLFRNTSLDEEKLNHIFKSLNTEEKELITEAFEILGERSKQCLSP